MYFILRGEVAFYIKSFKRLKKKQPDESASNNPQAMRGFYSGILAMTLAKKAIRKFQRKKQMAKLAAKGVVQTPS
jgi:hypothetical protein